MASSYFVTFGDNRLTFPGATGSVAWEATEPLPLFSVTFGEGNQYSAGLIVYDSADNVLYSSAPGTAKKTATGIPSGSKVVFTASSPKYYTYKASSYTGFEADPVPEYFGERDGVGASASGIITADASCRLTEGSTKRFRVEGNWPKPGGAGMYASVYCRPTAFSSYIGSTVSAGSKLNIRSSWTANNVSHQGNSWGAGGNVTAAGWRPRNVSSNRWSGWCDTTGTTRVINGYLESAGGFATFGAKSSANYIARSWGETTTQNFYCAGRSAAGGTVITAIKGWWWGTGIAP